MLEASVTPVVNKGGVVSIKNDLLIEALLPAVSVTVSVKVATPSASAVTLSTL